MCGLIGGPRVDCDRGFEGGARRVDTDAPRGLLGARRVEPDDADDPNDSVKLLGRAVRADCDVSPAPLLKINPSVGGERMLALLPIVLALWSGLCDEVRGFNTGLVGERSARSMPLSPLLLALEVKFVFKVEPRDSAKPCSSPEYCWICSPKLLRPCPCDIDAGSTVWLEPEFHVLSGLFAPTMVALRDGDSELCAASNVPPPADAATAATDLATGDCI